MKTETLINDKFAYLEDFIRRLPDRFSNSGEIIYIGRNEVRVININGLILAVKYFKRLTLANRYIYATFRKSKARRAYEHTGLLLEKGITSPENVAYVNCYKYGMLYKAYYVSLFTDYKQLKDLVALPISETEEVLKAFARFTFKLHGSGVFHNDYTIYNVLYSFTDNQYDFSLIDNNRMSFTDYSFRKGMKNLKRLSVPVDILGVIAAEYSKEANINDYLTLNMMVFSRLRQMAQISFKRWIKAPLRWITGKKNSLPINIKIRDKPVD